MATNTKIPSGMIDALCLVCRPNGGLAVILPEGTTTCPNGNHEVHPLSLPSVPRPENVVALRMAQNTSSELAAVLSNPSPAPAPAERPAAKAPPEPVTIRADDESGVRWLWTTRAYREHLRDEEISLRARLKEVVAIGKRLDLVDQLFDLEPAAIDDEPEIETIVSQVVPELASPITEPEPLPAQVSEPTTNGIARANCKACGRRVGFDGAHGRCARCTQHWRNHKREWPIRADGSMVRVRVNEKQLAQERAHVNR